MLGRRLAAILLLLSVAAPAWAQTSQSYQVPTGRLISQSTGGNINTSTGTAEQTLFTYSLPAYYLNFPGKFIRACAYFKKAANSDTVTARLYFGAEVISSGANSASSAGDMNLCLDISWQSATVNKQTVTGTGFVGTGTIVPYNANATETQTAAITIKATCQDGTSAASDCTLMHFYVLGLN
jgi:hypothetical protein